MEPLQRVQLSGGKVGLGVGFVDEVLAEKNLDYKKNDLSKKGFTFINGSSSSRF